MSLILICQCTAHITKMLSLPLKTTQHRREWETILHIAQQNGFLPAMMHKLRHQIEHKTKHTPPQDRKNKKLATFTYISPQIRKNHELVQKHQHKDKT